MRLHLSIVFGSLLLLIGCGDGSSSRGQTAGTAPLYEKDSPPTDSSTTPTNSETADTTSEGSEETTSTGSELPASECANPITGSITFDAGCPVLATQSISKSFTMIASSTSRNGKTGTIMVSWLSESTEPDSKRFYTIDDFEVVGKPFVIVGYREDSEDDVVPISYSVRFNVSPTAAGDSYDVEFTFSETLNGELLNLSGSFVR